MKSFDRLIRGLEVIDGFLIRICTVFGTLFCMILAFAVIIGVIARFVFNMPFAWSEEIPKYCMIWMTFLGAPVVMHHGGHVAVDGWHSSLSPRLGHLVRLAVCLICCAILCLFVWYGWRSALSAQYQKVIIMGNLSMFWVYLSIPLGSALFLFSTTVRALKELRGLCSPEPSV